MKMTDRSTPQDKEFPLLPEEISTLSPAPSESPDAEETPLVIIKPQTGLLNVDPVELWHYRDLLYFLVRREVLVRYKQTILGAAWAILQPLAGMIVFTIFFGKLAKMPSDGLPYPLFSYCGLLIWTFFAQATNESANSLVSNTNLVTKIYFPRLLMPVAPVLSSLLDLAIACLVLMALMIYYGVLPSVNIWALPLMISVAGVAALGVGTALSALNVKYRDFRYVLPFLTQLWLFASPIVYPASMVPETWRLLYALNPMAGAVEGFRWALLGSGANPWPLVAVSALSATTMLLVGIIHFKRTENFFADLI